MTTNKKEVKHKCEDCIKRDVRIESIESGKICYVGNNPETCIAKHIIFQ